MVIRVGYTIHWTLEMDGDGTYVVVGYVFTLGNITLGVDRFRRDTEQVNTLGGCTGTTSGVCIAGCM